MFYLLIGMPQGAEWLIILVIVVFVFGAAKLPELARGTGQALRIFKNETKGLHDEDDRPDTPTVIAAPIEPPQTSGSQADVTGQSDDEPDAHTDKHAG